MLKCVTTLVCDFKPDLFSTCQNDDDNNKHLFRAKHDNKTRRQKEK